jgi:hypothetical protein
LDIPEAQHFGFLSGPRKALERAKAAKQVEVQLDSGRTLAIQVLEVSVTGLALMKLVSAVSSLATNVQRHGPWPIQRNFSTDPLQ